MTRREAQLEEHLFKAKLAEVSERYEEMIDQMRCLVLLKNNRLSREERNLFAVSYKHAIAARRASWRTLYTVESNEKQQGAAVSLKLTNLTDGLRTKRLGRGEQSGSTSPASSANASLGIQSGGEDEKQEYLLLKSQLNSHSFKLETTRAYRLRVEAEVRALCLDVVELVVKKVLPHLSVVLASLVPTVQSELQAYKDKSMSEIDSHLARATYRVLEVWIGGEHSESVVFFLKMLGDHCRYLAELHVDNETLRQSEAVNSLVAYHLATELAVIGLNPADPIRLGVALNFSSFCYEILSQPERACQVGKKAFDAAMGELDSMKPVSGESDGDDKVDGGVASAGSASQTSSGCAVIQGSVRYQDATLIMRALKHYLKQISQD